MNAQAQIFWQEYLNSLPHPPTNPKVYASVAGSREITDELVALYLAKKKCAGSGLVADYNSAGDPLPAVGDYWVILDSDENPRVIVQTTRVQITKYKDVSSDVAIAEGEGDLSLDYWRQAHGRFWEPNLAKFGVSDLNEAEVITEFFEIVWPREA